MDPVTFSIGMTVLGGGIDAYGKYAAGQAKSKMYGYQAGVADLNSKIQKQNSEWALQAGGRDRVRSGMQTGQMIGKQRIGYAAGNLDVDFGSAEDVQESQRKVGRMDQDTITANAGRRAYGHLVEAENERAKGAAYRYASKNAKAEGILGAIGSVIGTASSVSSKWMDAKRLGMLGSGSESDDYIGSAELFEFI